MIKSTLIQLKNNKLISSFIILACTVAIFTFSLAVSQFFEGKKMLDDSMKYTGNKLIVEIASNPGIPFNSLNEYLKTYLNNNYITIKLPAEIGEDGTNWVMDGVFNTDYNVYFPLINGRYFNASDFDSNEKIAILGYTFSHRIIKENNDDFVLLNGEKYKVVGVVGYPERNSGYDTLVQLPVTTQLENLTKEPLKSITFEINNSSAIAIEDVEPFKEFITKIDNEAKINIHKDDSMGMKKSINNQTIKYTSKETGVILMISLLNIITVGLYWIKKRKKEFAIRKMCGSTSVKIITIALSDFITLATIGAIIALSIQFIISYTFTDKLRLMGISRYFSITNYLYAFLLTLVFGIITTITSLYSILKIQPAEAIKK